mmetsp:Transcript_64116/g.119209  ORF Transcript_64116/g.119209 Transcript_64116/m.119209 type:complete len:191 (-) Transcript_64116:17-589(-)
MVLRGCGTEDVALLIPSAGQKHASSRYDLTGFATVKERVIVNSTPTRKVVRIHYVPKQQPIATPAVNQAELLSNAPAPPEALQVKSGMDGSSFAASQDSSSFTKKPPKRMPEPEAEYGSPFLCYPMVTVKPPRPEADTGQDDGQSEVVNPPTMAGFTGSADVLVGLQWWQQRTLANSSINYKSLVARSFL